MALKSECRIDDDGRECTKCHRYQPWDEFHKAGGRNINGHGPRCKTCVRGDKSPKIPEHDDKGRVCSKCHVYKLWRQFSLQATGHNGHQSACKVCSDTRNTCACGNPKGRKSKRCRKCNNADKFKGKIYEDGRECSK